MEKEPISIFLDVDDIFLKYGYKTNSELNTELQTQDLELSSVLEKLGEENEEKVTKFFESQKNPYIQSEIEAIQKMHSLPNYNLFLLTEASNIGHTLFLLKLLKENNISKKLIKIEKNFLKEKKIDFLISSKIDKFFNLFENLEKKIDYKNQLIYYFNHPFNYLKEILNRKGKDADFSKEKSVFEIENPEFSSAGYQLQAVRNLYQIIPKIDILTDLKNSKLPEQEVKVIGYMYRSEKLVSKLLYLDLTLDSFPYIYTPILRESDWKNLDIVIHKMQHKETTKYVSSKKDTVKLLGDPDNFLLTWDRLEFTKKIEELLKSEDIQKVINEKSEDYKFKYFNKNTSKIRGPDYITINRNTSIEVIIKNLNFKGN